MGGLCINVLALACDHVSTRRTTLMRQQFCVCCRCVTALMTHAYTHLVPGFLSARLVPWIQLAYAPHCDVERHRLCILRCVVLHWKECTQVLEFMRPGTRNSSWSWHAALLFLLSPWFQCCVSLTYCILPGWAYDLTQLRCSLSILAT